MTHQENGKQAHRVRAMDMLNVLLLLPFLRHNLLEEEVVECNCENPLESIGWIYSNGFVAAGTVSPVSTAISTKGQGGYPGPTSLESEVLIILRFD